MITIKYNNNNEKDLDNINEISNKEQLDIIELEIRGCDGHLQFLSYLLCNIIDFN